MCEKCEEHHCGGGSEKNAVIKIFAVIFLLVAAVIMQTSNIKIILLLSAYLITGADVIFTAVKNIFKGKIFDENFLMSIATIGALCLNDMFEAVSVMILYKTGDYLQHKAVNNSRNAVSKLTDIRAEYANIEENGEIKQVKPETVKINDIITVKTGEKVPLDGVIIEGFSYLDTSSLTGESILKKAGAGDDILSGSVNTGGVLKIKVNKPYKDSAVSKILELVENAAKCKSKTEKFITGFAKYYTPAVVICAVLIAVIPVYTSGLEYAGIWIERALIFLVISCPCALVISVPLTFFAGIGGASKKGILIKGSGYLEKLSAVDTAVFDKTGTLTKGKLKVSSILTAEGIKKEQLLEYAAAAEYYSNHPIASAVKEAYGKKTDGSKIKNIKEEAGKGIKVLLLNDEILAGNEKLMKEYNINIPVKNKTAVYIAKNNKYAGCLIIEDELKENAKELVLNLKKLGIKTVMLTGDLLRNAEKTAEELGIDEYYAELLPDGKVEKLENIIKRKKADKNVIFAGDGINDAPVLMRSDIGIAMGALGSDAAVEAADVVISDDNLSKITEAVISAKRTMQIAKQNIIFALGVKLIFLATGAAGLITMWGGVFADTGIALLAVLNSLRAMK